MRYGVAVLLLLAAVACAPATGEQEPAAVQETTTEADVEAIRGAVDQILAATEAGDAAAWMELFTEDAVVMPPNEAAISGMEALEAWGSPYFENYTMEETNSIDEIEVAGDWAFVRGTSTFHATPKAEVEVEELEEIGKFLYIMMRQPDGSWKFSRLIWNSDSPPPEM